MPVTKTTDQLRPDDVVLTHGMHVRLDHGTSMRSGTDRVYTWHGTVIDRRLSLVPRSHLSTATWDPEQGWVPDREDAWTVQGTVFAQWIVQNPARPEATP